MKELIKKRLIEEINLSGLTVSEIALHMNISSEMITQYKTTGKLPSLENFAKLCKILKCSANYILGLED